MYIIFIFKMNTKSKYSFIGHTVYPTYINV